MLDTGINQNRDGLHNTGEDKLPIGFLALGGVVIFMLLVLLWVLFASPDVAQTTVELKLEELK